MEQKLSNGEIVKVLMMYFGSLCEYGYEGNRYIGKLIGYDYRYGFMLSNESVGAPYRFVRYELISPLLTHLSSISDEDAIQVCKMFYPHKNYGIVQSSNLGKIIAKDFIIQKETLNLQAYLSLQQYLIQQGYAVPLFFGIDHWANGKSALDLGIAITKQP